MPEMFEPAPYSLEELAFMLEHLEETPTTALYGDVPKGVNPVAIKTALGRFAELAELERVRGVPWSGYAPIRKSIERYLAYQKKCRDYQKLGEPRHPSQLTFDSRGNPFRGGIGADNAEMIRNELSENGDREPFGVQLVGTPRPSRIWGQKKKPSGKGDDAKTPQPINDEPVVFDRITHDAEKGVLECSICDKVVASYDPDKGSRARNKAIAEARSHCLKTRTEQARHRAILNAIVE